MGFELTYKPFGERSILVEWPSEISEQILNDIIRFKTNIEEKNIKSIVEIKSAYNSLLITYISVCRNFENEVKTLKNIYYEPKTMLTGCQFYGKFRYVMRIVSQLI